MRTADPKQRWLTFVRNHAQAIVACDFFVVVTATFRVLYVFVVMELGTRRIVHYNVTAHPDGGLDVQQFREALPGVHAYRLSFTTGTAFSPRNSTKRLLPWECGC